MISKIFLILSVLSFCSAVLSAPLYCENTSENRLTGIIDSAVIIDGTNCSMRGATITGDVTVIENGHLSIISNMIFQKTVIGGSGSTMKIFESTVDGRIHSANSARLDIARSALKGPVSVNDVTAVLFVVSKFEKDVSLNNVEETEVYLASRFRESFSVSIDASFPQSASSSLTISESSIVRVKFTVTGTVQKSFSFVFIDAAIMEQAVTMTDVGGIHIINGAHLKNGLNTRRMANTYIQVNTFPVLIDGPVEDVDGYGAFIVSGARFTPSVTLTNRDGDVYIQNMGEQRVKVNGEVVVDGGKGYAFVRWVEAFAEIDVQESKWKLHCSRCGTIRLVAF